MFMQLAWFLAPKVELAAQQFEYLRSQLSSVQVICLTGADGCDRWTDVGLWDALLQDVKVVVSTPKILEDALTHGFVSVSRLSLLVFDEGKVSMTNLGVITDY
jgi:ERCC4-related helicase